MTLAFKNLMKYSATHRFAYNNQNMFQSKGVAVDFNVEVVPYMGASQKGGIWPWASKVK